MNSAPPPDESPPPPTESDQGDKPLQPTNPIASERSSPDQEDEPKDEAMSEAPPSPTETKLPTGVSNSQIGDTPVESLNAESQPAPLSYKEKLMGNEGTTTKEPEFSIATDDLVIAVDDLGQHLTISQRLEEYAQQSLKYTVVVKLVGKSIGYSLQIKISL